VVSRIDRVIEVDVIVLGTDGRLLSLQLEELVTGVDADRELVVRDYLPNGKKSRTPEAVLDDLEALDATDLVDINAIARSLGLGTSEHLDDPASPRGYRLLARVPRLPGAVVERLVDHFGGLQKLLAASIDDLQAVDGVGELRARSVREGLSRLAESSILERYV
jgi:diadenylate cyclase